MPRYTKLKRTRTYLKRRGNKREARPEKKLTAEEELDAAFARVAAGRGWFFKSPSLAEEDQEQK